MARRIFLLFVCCALLPIIILAAVSFYQVSDQLQIQGQKQLSQMAKAQAMDLYNRLQLAEAELQVLSLQIGDGRHPVLGASRTHFLAMTVFNDRGEELTDSGTRATFLDPALLARLRTLDEKPLIIIHSCSDQFGNCVAMARRINLGQADKGILVGEMNSGYLWEGQRLPSAFDTCVATSSRATLFCSDPGMVDSANTLPRQISQSSGFFQWKRDQTLYDTAYWGLLLRPGFSTESWTITVSQKHDEVLAPMRHFRSSFPLVILLAFWIVTLSSSVQIRRTLVPLEELQTATHQVGDQHFDKQVVVKSGDEFEALAGSFNAMTNRLGRQFHALKTINAIDQAIFASLNYEAIADAVLDHMPYLLPCDCIAVSMFGGPSHPGWTRFKRAPAGTAQSILNPQLSASEQQQFQVNPEYFVVAANQVPQFIGPLRAAGLTSFLVLPIFVDKAPFAALVYGHEDPPQMPADDLQQARQVADQVAVAFSNAQLVEALERLHWGTLTALARAIDAKSAWTAGHSERVTALAVKIGSAMGLSPKDLQIMHRGGLLHDIGKIGTPPTILDKPGKLDPEETRAMQDHVRIGARILEPIPSFREALPIVLQHHEWFDGSGYPEGIAGENISLYARIFAVADCYDAMTSDRPYRKGLPEEEVREIITRQSGTHFDPKVVEVFTQLVAQEEGSAGDVSARAVGAGQSV
ncbi:MAG: HD domain-containing protein [Acidobacteriia bacterium]|nr:HD domain-containing protein [Terriglobia bacterium]